MRSSAPARAIPARLAPASAESSSELVVLRSGVAVAQTRGIAPSLLVSPTEAVRTGPPPRYSWILVSPSAAGLDYRCRPLQRPGFVQQRPWRPAAALEEWESPRLFTDQPPTDAGAVPGPS